MHDQYLEAKIVELTRLKEADLLPFPYGDCRDLLASGIGRQKRYRDLIPDLDVYFSWVSGSCSWGGKICQWPPERMRKGLKLSQASFFEWFPVYKPLRLRIVKWCYPELYRDFKKHEEMKRLLAEILAYLLAQLDLPQVEVVVPQKEPDNPFRPRQFPRKVRLAHRQAGKKMARERCGHIKKPIKFQGPALRIVSIKPLGERIF